MEAYSERSYPSSMDGDMYHFDFLQVELIPELPEEQARRRTSVQEGWIDMEELIERSNPNEERKVHSIVPNFKPAFGCTNASDYVLRCFCARLRQGITVLRHHRWYWTKSQIVTLYLLPDCKTLKWKADKHTRSKAGNMKLNLTHCTEVRRALSADPAKNQHLGTGVLRRHCTIQMASQSLSLIFPKFTFDMTASTADSFKVLLEGFSALCFRLQMAKLQPNDEEDSSINSDFRVASGPSTVYATESSESAALSTAPFGLQSPWGL